MHMRLNMKAPSVTRNNKSCFSELTMANNYMPSIYQRLKMLVHQLHYLTIEFKNTMQNIIKYVKWSIELHIKLTTFTASL